MGFLTYEEFQQYPTGVTITEDEFKSLLMYAEETIDNLTHQRARKIIEAIKKATALQIAYLALNGGIDAALSPGQATGETIGSYSYSLANNGKQSAQTSYSPIVRQVLRSTGLLYSGIGCDVW